jgi:sulfatase maturation enzyme AslB (radical SAM superfamily)
MSTIILDPTGRCNLHCCHCYAEAYRDLHPSKEALLGIVSLLPEGINVNLVGGEVMVREDIYELIQACVQRGHRTSIATNATLINSGVAKALARAGVSTVSCSLDGPSPEVHDVVRGRGAFRRALKGILYLHEIMSSNDALTINYTVNSGNYRHVEETMDLLDREGIYARISLERTFAGGTAALNRHLIPSDEQWLDACAQVCQGWKRWPRLSSLTFLGLPRFVRIMSAKFGVALSESSYYCPVLTGDIWGRIFADGKLYSCGRREMLDEACSRGLLPEEGQQAKELLAKQQAAPSPYPSSVSRMRSVAAPPDDPFCRSCPDRSICTNCPGAILLGRAPRPSLCILASQRYEEITEQTKPCGIGITGRIAAQQHPEGIQLCPGVYTKDLRNGAKLVFVPGKPHALHLEEDAAATWTGIVAGRSLPHLKYRHKPVPIIDNLALDVEGFLTILQRFGAVEQ